MDENCSCKDQLILGKDHHELLSEYTDSEEKSLHALDVQMSLGIGLQTFDFETLLYECNSYSVDKNDGQSNISKELNYLNVSMQSITLEDQLCSEDENDTLTPVREIVDSTSDDASLNLENIADTDEFLDDVLQEADFMEGIRPLDISVDDEQSENVNAEQIMSTLNIIDDNNCTQDATTSLSEENFQATSLYFKQFIVPPLLCRHPPPAQGRDDDISHLKEILSDVLTKLGRYTGKIYTNRILFAPDNKISKKSHPADEVR